MPELALDLINRPALADAKIGSFGPAPAALTIRALPEGHVVQVLGSPGSGDLTDRLTRLCDSGAGAVRRAGPGQWLIVGDVPLAADGVSTLERDLAGTAALVDQSHGRVRIAVSGASVEAMLAKGTGVDPALRQFPVGRSVNTLIGHISVHLNRMSETAFEIIVMRSFAQSLWDELIDMGRAFGITARLA
jgi:sarcosine oxidase subunit gamma